MGHVDIWMVSTCISSLTHMFVKDWDTYGNKNILSLFTLLDGPFAGVDRGQSRNNIWITTIFVLDYNGDVWV